MNTRGVALWSIVVFVAALVVLFAFSLFTSSAILSGDTFVLGENVKLELDGIESYRVKIQTPSTTYLREGENDIFVFRPEEVGEYSIDLTYGDVRETYAFTVVDSFEDFSEEEAPEALRRERPGIVVDETFVDEEGAFDETTVSFAFHEATSIDSATEWTRREYVSPGEVVRIPMHARDIVVTSEADNVQTELVPTIDTRTLANSVSRVLSLNRNVGHQELSFGDFEGLVAISYVLPGPEQKERNRLGQRKRVTVHAPRGVVYSDIAVSTNVPELVPLSNPDALSVYWHTDRRAITFDVFDDNNNGLIDRISWVAPSVSEEVFDIEITILTVKSFPVVGGEWRAQFSTVGTADLRINAVDGTLWRRDLSFVQVLCGDTRVPHEWDGESVFIANYSCEHTSTEVSNVLTAGPHTLEFDFGGEKAYAYNEASLYQLIGEWGRVTDLPQDSWTTVNFNHTFNTTPVVVHSAEYDYTYNDNPCHPRLRSINTTSFQIRTESWDSDAFDSNCSATGVNAYWVAMEPGIHTVGDNGVARRTVEVVNFTLDQAACGSGANPADYTYAANQRMFQHNWTATPLVLSAVQTANDLDPIATYIHGCSSQAAIWDTTCVEIGMNGLENDGVFQPCTEHTLNETGGYIAWEMDANWTDAETRDNNGTIGNDRRTYYWEAYWESDNVEGTQNDPAPLGSYFVRLTQNWTQGAAFGSGIRIDGGNGLLPALDFDATDDQVFLVADEDENGDSEQSHTAEPWQVLFFNMTSGFLYSNETNPAPVISNVNATSLSDSSATIVWNTDLVANSTVEYGTTISLGSESGDATLVINHSVFISGLSTLTLYHYNVTSCSEFGICATSGPFNFTTTVGTPPIIFNITPVNGSTVASPVPLSASTSENATCQYSTTETFVYGTGTNFTSGAGTLFHSTSLGALSTANYTYYIKCEDLASNANDDSNQGVTTFTVDADAPTVTLNLPVSGEIDEVSDTDFNFTVSDNLASSLTCDLYIDDTLQQADISVASGASHQFTTEVVYGPHNWTVACGDSVSNNRTETTWFVFGEPRSSNIGEVGRLEVNASAWRRVAFSVPFDEPVVVTGYEFPFTGSTPPVTVRVRNVNVSGFEMMVELANSTATASQVGDLNVTYLVVDQGVHFMEDGTRIEAYAYNTSTVSSSGNGWTSGDNKQYNHTYATAPIVLHQVMTYADTNWITSFVSLNGDATNPPNITDFQISLNGAEFTNTHGTETLGYVVIERANGTNDNRLYEGEISGDIVEGVGNDASCTSYAVSFDNTYSSSPFVLSAIQTIDGANGGWSHVCNISTLQVNVRVDEDQFNDDERSHTTEDVAIFAFESAGVILSNTTVSLPQITNVNATDISDSGALITWNTNITSNSTVYYGLSDDSYFTSSETANVLNHSIQLFSLMENTTYFYVVESCDQGCNVSGTYNFTTLIGTPPTIFNITPLNGSLASNPVTLSASTSENAWCEYSTTETFVYGTGTDFTTGQGTLFHSVSLGSLADGTHTYYIKCEDASNNTNTDATQGVTTFNVDETPPSITLHHPIEGSTQPSSVFFNWTATDAIDTVLSCDLTVNSVVQQANVSSPSGVVVNTTVSLNDGLYFWNVTCVDDGSNSNISETRSFIVGANILTNVTTNSDSYNQGQIANISVNTTDLGFDALQTNTTTDVVFGISLDNSSIWWNSSWQYRQGFRIRELSGENLQDYQINLTFDTQSLISNGYMNASCSDIRVADSNLQTLPFYVQNSSYNGCNSTITQLWVQLDSLEGNKSTVIYVYYGNNESNTQSSIFSVFNYSTPQELFYVVSDGVSDVDVVSFVNGNNVSNGSTYVSLDRNNVTTFSVNQTSIISASGPAFAISDDNAADALVPISFAGTEFVYAVNRFNDVWNVYSPFGDAEVCVYDGEDGSGWTLIGTCFTVTQNGATTVTRNIGGTSSTADAANTDAVYINSTFPVLITHDSDSPSDAFVLHPSYTDWWGVPSTRLLVGVLEDSTVVQVHYSNGSNSNFSRNEGQDIYLDGFATGGQDVAVHVISNNPVGVTQEADQDGSEMTTFLPEYTLDVEYFIPQTASYITVAATYPNTNCTLYDNTGTILSSSLTTGNNPRPSPSKWYYGPDTSGNNIPAGSRLTCDQPVYAYYEQFGAGGDDEERNLWSVKTSRLFVSPEPAVTETGVQEQFIGRTTGETGANGIFSFSFDTTSQNIGNHTAISLGERNLFDNGTGQTVFEIFPPVANVPPVVNLVNPANETFYNAAEVTLFYNASDANDNIANATLILNGARNITNQTVIINHATTNNFTLNLSDGVYTWTVNVTDTTNFEGTDNVTRTFTVDTEAPNISLYNPLDGANVGQANVFFNFSIQDNLDSTLVCDLIIDSTVFQDDFNAQNGTFVNFTETLSAGFHLWNVTCVDDATNVGVSSTYNFTITEAPPTVELITVNNTYTTTGNITLVYNATDNNGFSEARLIIDGGLNQTNQTQVFNGNYSNFSILNFAEGFYFWTVNVTDTAGLNATADSRRFIVDLNDPIVSLNAPANNFVSNLSSLSFNFTVTDAIDTSLTCDLYVGEQSSLGFAAANGTLTNRVISGLTDGQKIWNVTCTDDSGRVGFSGNRFVNITEYPTIALQTTNNSFYNISTFNLSYLPTDNTGFGSCDLYINGAFNQTNQTVVVNGAQNNFTHTSGSGAFDWYVQCVDSFGLQNQSETRTFTVDFDPPSIDLSAPADGGNFFSSTVLFNYTAIDNLDPSIACDVVVNGVTEDSFNATNGTLTSRSVVFASGGLKWWNVTCADDSGNLNISETRNFTLSFAPQVTLRNPPNDTVQNNATITLFYEVTDDNNNLANATLILNGVPNITNQSVLLNEQENNFTIVLPDGHYNWTVNVTDTTNLMGTDLNIRNFTIDTQPPVITLKEPPNNTFLAWNNFTYNFSVSDNIDGSLSCNIYANGALNHTVTAANGSDTLVSSILPDGLYLWNVTCVDDANNTGVSTIFNFSMEAPPNVSLVSPTTNFTSNTSSITFRYFVDDPIGISNCSIYIDDTEEDFTDSPSVGSINSFIINSIAEGYHNWTVQCFDSAPDNNPSQPDAWNFTVDLTPPLVTLHAPLNDSTTLRDVTFNFTVIDNLDLRLSCDLYVDGAVNVSNIGATNGTNTLQGVSGFGLGVHDWNVTCVDDAAYSNTSLTWIFNVSLADVAINYTDIVFNNTGPTENETIIINATVHNLVNASVFNVTVQFFAKDPDIDGVQINGNVTIPEIAGLGTETVNVVYNTVLGTTQIYALVDPPLATNGTIAEANETNNEANRSIVVGGWQFVYGDITQQSIFELNDAERSPVVTWNVTDLDDVKIYVTDYEAVILWTSLQAIGRNIAGGTTTNDFAELDTLLNMTGFVDSITTLFTNGTDPTNTTDTYVFNQLITNIPIANSTNSTAFYTGILWDTDDDDIADIETEFSSEDAEDLVFFTQVRENTGGAYGVYDYEMRIPANLRRYDATDSARVAFYTEVK